MLLAVASPALGEEKGRVALKRKSLLGAKVRLYLARDGALEGEPTNKSELARALDIRPGTVWAWISKGTRPGSKTLTALARLMRVDSEWMTDDSQPAQWPPPPTERRLDAILEGADEDTIEAFFAAWGDSRTRDVLLGIGRRILAERGYRPRGQRRGRR